MKKHKLTGFVVAFVIAAVGLLFAHDAQKFTGAVSDSMCGAKHMTKDKSPADCARACAQQGDYALVVGDNVYTLSGDKNAIGKFAGAKAVVEGNLEGNTIKVESIQAPK